jgi:hypothetical protein
MSRFFQKRAAGPELSQETLRRLDILFPPEDRERAKALLYEQCGNNLAYYEIERIRFAALKYSDGNLLLLDRAVKLAQQDWRDLLMAAGFGDVEAHRAWEPKPAGEPSEIDPPQLVATIHDRLAIALSPMGFERQGDEWRRGGEVPQILRVLTGLTSRTEVKFFLQVILEAEPVSVLRHLPRLQGMLGEQGYIFRVGGKEEVLYAAVLGDFTRYALPWFQRFISANEVLRGFDDGTFKPHLKIEGRALVF